MILPKNPMNLTLRLHFLTDVTALKYLSSPEAVAYLEDAIESISIRDRRNFLRGYRLAVATPLHGLLWFVADYPELLGLEGDDRLYNWLHYGNPAKDKSLLSAVSNPASDLSRLCYVFNDLQVALRRAENGLADTISAIGKCRKVAARFAGVLIGTKIVSLDTGKEPSDKESLFRMCLAERVVDYLDHDPSIISLARELVWSRGEELRPIDDRFILDAETHLDRVASFPSATGIPKEWGDGFRFGCDLLMWLSGIVLPSHVDSGPVTYQDWFNELLAFAKPSYPKGEWPSMKYGLTEFTESNVRRFLEHFEVNMDTVFSKHRLAAVLGPDSVRLMSSTGATAPLELEVMLRGAVAMHGDSKVRLLLMTHSVASDDRQWVSVAFRLPIYGPISNASKWFLFYKMYHTGPVFDTDVARAAKAVERLLLQFKDNLEVEELGSLDSEDFLPLCVLPAFRAMRELSLEAAKTNTDLRSRNLELLAILWLVNQGYDHVRVSFKHAPLGKFEYDAIGVKNDQCLVFEVKSSRIVDDELQEQIRRFAGKVDHLRDRLPDLTKALGCESAIENISGIFVFLGDLDNFKPTVTSITLWGYDDFVKALKAVDIPGRIVGLLDRSHIIRHVRLDDFPHDPFCVGL